MRFLIATVVPVLAALPSDAALAGAAPHGLAAAAFMAAQDPRVEPVGPGHRGVEIAQGDLPVGRGGADPRLEPRDPYEGARSPEAPERLEESAFDRVLDRDDLEVPTLLEYEDDEALGAEELPPEPEETAAPAPPPVRPEIIRNPYYTPPAE